VSESGERSNNILYSINSRGSLQPKRVLAQKTNIQVIIRV